MALTDEQLSQERDAFKAAHRHLDLSERDGAWNKPHFLASHVESAWMGWRDRAVAIVPLLARIAALEAQVEQAAQPVLVVEREPDYWSGGHFHKGEKPHVDPTKVWALPIGTKLYTAPPKAVPLTDEQCDAIASSLDDWACEVDHYEFGLPIHVNAEANTWRAIIRAATVVKGASDAN